MLRALGQFPTPVELAELMERMDANRNGVASLLPGGPGWLCAGQPVKWRERPQPGPRTASGPVLQSLPSVSLLGPALKLDAELPVPLFRLQRSIFAQLLPCQQMRRGRRAAGAQAAHVEPSLPAG